MSEGQTRSLYFARRVSALRGNTRQTLCGGVTEWRASMGQRQLRRPLSSSSRSASWKTTQRRRRLAIYYSHSRGISYDQHLVSQLRMLLQTVKLGISPSVATPLSSVSTKLRDKERYFLLFSSLPSSLLLILRLEWNVRECI